MASKTICLPALSLLFLLFALSEAREVTVDGWTVQNSDHLTKWTHRHHFTAGDVLKWNTSTSKSFDPPVLQVTKEAFESCDISNPLKANVTEVTLNPAGMFYFISGVKENCDKGLKITVKVHAHRNKDHGAPAPAPALAPEMNNLASAPAAAPTSAAPHVFIGVGFMAFVVIGVVGVVGMV
ncbi:PREDICTED: early nodulin-like protein 1 [Fragaria vesca subsp. vesca]|uniref:early nodulin-like protein 1 n=1 Tax=Fragaria vesca subsp. vesca TaxID=101020 RepID=UPI0002C308E7|nr:PREDICTED: early nodulin-like protein 1 [Fragaria vesca subsp. vesca]